MSDAQVTAQVTTHSYPKRKRAQVSYYEGEPDDSESHESDDEVIEFSANKKAKTKSRPLPKRKIFPFLSLPAELRNIIYEHALMDEGGVCLTAKTEHYRRVVVRHTPNLDAYTTEQRVPRYENGVLYMDPNSEENETINPVSFVPAILAVNRQIYTEALPILYANKFTLMDTTVLHTFMANIAPRTRELVEHIVIQGWGYSRTEKARNYPGLTMLAGALNLKCVDFQCRLGWGFTPRSVARQIYRDGFHWLEAVGVAKGQADAAVDVITMSDENFGGRYSWRAQVEPVDAEAGMETFRAELRRLLTYRKTTKSSKGKSKGKGKGEE